MGDIIKRKDFVEDIDDGLNETISQTINQIKEDRDRAMRVYLELLNLFHSGKNDAEDIKELNRAQELVIKTTEALQRVVNTLARIKVGEAKVQLAMINNSGDDDRHAELDRQKLIEAAEDILGKETADYVFSSQNEIEETIIDE